MVWHVFNVHSSSCCGSDSHYKDFIVRRSVQTPLLRFMTQEWPIIHDIMTRLHGGKTGNQKLSFENGTHTSHLHTEETFCPWLHTVHLFLSIWPRCEGELCSTSCQLAAQCSVMFFCKSYLTSNNYKKKKNTSSWLTPSMWCGHLKWGDVKTSCDSFFEIGCSPTQLYHQYLFLGELWPLCPCSVFHFLQLKASSSLKP